MKKILVCCINAWRTGHPAPCDGTMPSLCFKHQQAPVRPEDRSCDRVFLRSLPIKNPIKILSVNSPEPDISDVVESQRTRTGSIHRDHRSGRIREDFSIGKSSKTDIVPSYQFFSIKSPAKFYKNIPQSLVSLFKKYKKKEPVLSFVIIVRPFKVKEPFTGKVQVVFPGINPDEFAMMF